MRVSFDPDGIACAQCANVEFFVEGPRRTVRMTGAHIATPLMIGQIEHEMISMNHVV